MKKFPKIGDKVAKQMVLDLKGKLNYDEKGIFEQNIRVRTAFDDDFKSTQIRYSPITVNIPMGQDVSIYSNSTLLLI